MQRTTRTRTRKRTRIGVDAGSAQIKAVQLSGGPKGYELEAVAVVERIEPGETMAARDVERLADVLYRQGFTGSDIVLGAPTSLLVTGVFPVPPTDSGAPRDQIVRMELSRNHECDSQTMETASWEIGRASCRERV